MGVASLTLRPAVPMGHVTGVPFVAALGVAGALLLFYGLRGRGADCVRPGPRRLR